MRRLLRSCCCATSSARSCTPRSTSRAWRWAWPRCLILGLFLKSELTYDQHYKGYENIYRVEQ